jgi:tight adherence protein B
MIKQLLIGLVAVATIALLEGLFHTFRFFGEKRREELQRRLQSLGGTESAGLTLLRQGKLSGIPSLDGLLRAMPIAERLELLIEQAQVGITVARLIAYSMLAALVGVAVGLLIGRIPGALLLGVVGLVTPVGVIYVIRERRSRKLSEQLPDALDMMARSLRAGHALPASFKLVATEMPPPVSLEFGQAFEEQNLGMSFERAVVQMTRRAPNNGDLKIFAVSVIVQKETGGNLVEIIEKIADTIRKRYQFFGKLRTLTAEGRLSGVVIGALPFFAGTAAAILNPEYMKPLVTEPLGQWFLIYAVVTWLVGVWWLRRMAYVDL